MSLLIPTANVGTTHLGTTAEPRKIIAKPSRRCFNLTLDESTHQQLVRLQHDFTGPDILPSRTLITRLALRRLALEVRARKMGDNREWFDDRTAELQHLGLAGSK